MYIYIIIILFFLAIVFFLLSFIFFVFQNRTSSVLENTNTVNIEVSDDSTSDYEYSDVPVIIKTIDDC